MYTIVGTAADVAEELVRWVEEADVDGFNLIRTVSPECFSDFIELVIPELQRIGAYKRSYKDGTLREKLFEGGTVHLPADHVARQQTPL